MLVCYLPEFIFHAMVSGVSVRFVHRLYSERRIKINKTCWCACTHTHIHTHTHTHIHTHTLAQSARAVDYTVSISAKG